MTPVIDINDLSVQMLPPDKRLPKFEIMARTLVSPIDRINKLFQQYQDGDTLSDWYDAGYTYNTGDRTKDYYGVYESRKDGNTGNATSDDEWWEKVLPSFIGVKERQAYRADKIVFEYALNRFFGTEFRQYTDIAYTPNSDIYILTDTLSYISFLSGNIEADSSVSGTDGSTGYVANEEIFGTATTFLFTIYVPAAFHASLGVAADKIIRFFADKLNVSGITYNIATY